MLRVALIWPPGFDREYALPLAPGFLKSNTPAERYDIRLFDCVLAEAQPDGPELRAFLEEFKPQVVGVTSWSPMFPAALAALAAAKALNPAVVTIMGGAHVTSYTAKVMAEPAVDFGFRGEADLAFTRFLAEVESPAPDWASVPGLVWRRDGGMVANPVEMIEDLDRIAPPDYAFIGLERYLEAGYRLHCPEKRNAPILATRGCPYRCGFCAAPQLNGKPVRTHSPAYVTRLVERLHRDFGIRWINFVDDNFTFHVPWCKDVCRQLAGLDLPVGYGTPNGIRFQRGDAELWRLMKGAGWRSVVIAPETGSERTVKRMRKDIKLDAVPGTVADLKAAGLNVQAFFIVGYPGETPEDLADTRRMILETPFDFFYLNNFQPIPGTEVFNELVAAGEIPDTTLPRNYSDGVRTYTPPALAEVNFGKFVLQTYLLCALRRPAIVLTLLRQFNPMLIARKLLLNALASVRG